MNKARDGIPMRDRVALNRSPEQPCPGRHCWVTGGIGDDSGTKRPGLLIELRRGHMDWEGRVVYLDECGPNRWVLVEEWLPAVFLTSN